MVSSKSLALFALSGLALAKPHGHLHQHDARHMPHGTGPHGPRGSHGVRPTGGMQGGNGTWHDAPFPFPPAGGDGEGAGSPPVITATVEPMPQQPGGGAGAAPTPPAGGPPNAGPGGGANIPGASPPTGVNNAVPAQPTDTPVADATSPVGGGSGAPPAGGPPMGALPPAGGAPGGGSGSGSPAGGDGDCQASTTTVTVDQVVTVTADGMPPGGSPGGGGAAAPPAGSASLTNVQSPSAGEFFGQPTGGYHGGFPGGQYGPGNGGQPSGQPGGQNGGQPGGQPGALPTGQPGGQPGAIPTTFATMPSNTGGYGGAAPSATFGGSAAPSSTGGAGVGSGNGGGASSGGKRGLSFNDAAILTPFDNTGMSWAYNWASTESGALPAGVEYVPMCWGSQDISNFAQKAAGAKYVLSFNEPDLGGQADMTVQAAAQGHIQALNPLAAQGAQIGSPAVTNGGAPMGLTYLQNWFDACAGQCKVDFIAIHWYDSASNIAYFKQHVADAITLAEKNGVGKVWVTEFGVTSGDAATFIQEATSFLDSTPQVEKYAYFMAAEGNLLQGNGLSAAGKAYAGSA